MFPFLSCVASAVTSYIASTGVYSSTGTKPSSGSTDVLIAICGNFSTTQNISTPSGWTSIGGNTQGSSTIQLFWALGTVSALTFTNADIVSIISISGVNLTTPINALSWNPTNDSTAITATPSVATVAGGFLINGIYCWQMQGQSSGNLNDGPPYTQAQKVNDTGIDATLTVGYIQNTSAGTSPSYNFTSLNFTDRLAFNLSINPQ